MTNKRIPDLTAATTPLAGTELVPLWDGTTTKQVSVTNLTAGRAVAGTQFTASMGNFIPATSGKGVDFSAVTPAAGMTSKVLSNYEEGTWTPTVSFATGSVVLNSFIADYTRIGRQVTFTCRVNMTTTGVGASALTVGGLPFTAKASSVHFFADLVFNNYSSSLNPDGSVQVISGTNTFVYVDRAVLLIDTTFYLEFSGYYFV